MVNLIYFGNKTSGVHQSYSGVPSLANHDIEKNLPCHISLSVLTCILPLITLSKYFLCPLYQVLVSTIQKYHPNPWFHTTLGCSAT